MEAARKLSFSEFLGTILPLNHTLQRKVDLICLLTHKEFALKYKRTILGILWSLLNPILTACVFWIAFKVFMRFQIDNYTFFLLSALFPWSWFSSSVLISARSLVDNITLIKKVIFPRHYLVLAVIFSQLAHLLFSVPILFFLSLTSAQGPSLSWMAGIPILVSIQLIFTLGISLMVSVGNTYFRDIEYLVGVFMNLLFWMTPITYPLDAIPDNFRILLLLNPLSCLMASWRELFLKNTLLWKDIGIAFVIAVTFLIIGMAVFIKLEKRLDEVL